MRTAFCGPEDSGCAEAVAEGDGLEESDCDRGERECGEDGAGAGFDVLAASVSGLCGQPGGRSLSGGGGRRLGTFA